MTPYLVKAFNTAHASENKIHDDAVARRFGFTGGLVPGVEVYAYMMHLPVARWGRAFLEHGSAECRFSLPVYDGETAEVSGRETGDAIEIEVSARDKCSAIGSARMGDAGTAAPEVASYPEARPPAMEHRPGASSVTLAVGASLCTVPLEVTDEIAANYLRDVRETDGLYAREGIVHPGIVLRMCNQALLQNVKLGPWIHVGSKVRNAGVARVGESLVARSRVSGNYERKGHLFVELDVLVLGDGVRPLAQVQHTAIYRPRQLAVA